jgi:hypothetical protein
MLTPVMRLAVKRISHTFLAGHPGPPVQAMK